MRALILSISIASILIFSGKAFAKTASCPCSPCKCSPCNCGAGGSKGGKHHEKDRGKHDGGHAAVGVGANIDLGGVGHRDAEGNPFAVGGGGAPVAHTEEKKTTKKPGKGPEPVSFDKIELTGNEAKEVDNNPSEPPTGGNTVSDNEVKTNDSPAPETKEKPKAKKPKPTWPKPIQDWLDARTAVAVAENKEGEIKGAYYKARYKFYETSDHLKKLRRDADTACDKAKKEGATKEDKEACEKARQAVQDQISALDKDFDNTPEGKKLLADAKDAKAAVKTAQQTADNAAKDIDEATQKKVLKKMDKWYKEQAKEPAKEPAKE